MKKRVTVIGGGITGLAAANRLQELGRERSLDVEVLLLEASNRTGGAISTVEKDGFLIEEGPDSFITARPWALNLCGRLGLDGELIETEGAKRRTFVLRGGELMELPEGFIMLAPARIIPFLTSPLFSWRGKLSVLMDLVRPKKDPGDESVASFVRRRLGEEALERVAQPMIGGIYTGDPERLSIRSTMPQFPEMEDRYGSVLRGMLKTYRRRGRGGKPDSGARYSMFVTLRTGMQTLTDTLAGRLPPGSLKLNERVRRIDRARGGFRITTDGSVYESDGVLITTPAHATAEFIGDTDSGTASLLKTIEYASSAVVILVYKTKDMGLSLDGFGFVVPASEKKSFIACSFSSEKFRGRVPEGYTMLRAFAGGALNPGILGHDDETIIDRIEKELGPILRLGSGSFMSLIKRYPDSMPQYLVGHEELVESIMARVRRLDGLELAGNAFGGAGIPDCINSGERAAERVMESVCLRAL